MKTHHRITIAILGCLTQGIGAQTTWRQVSSGTTANLRSVAFVNGQFIACGENAGTAKEPLYGLVSSDGEHWRKTQLANMKQLVTFGDRVAGLESPITGESVSGLRAFVSRDGYSVAQIAPTTPSGTPLYYLTGISGANGRLFANGGGSFEFDSSTLNYSSSSAGLSVAYGNGIYLTIYTNGRSAFSADGTTWTFNVASSPGFLGQRVAFGNGMFITYDSMVRYKTASNGASWTAVAPNPGGDSLAFAEGKFAVANAQGTFFSSDAENWTQGLAAAGMNGIAYGSANLAVVPPAGRWVAVGDGGKIYISDSDTSVAANQTLSINGAVQLRWLGETGKSYQVQSSTNMAAWANSGEPIAGVGAEIVVSQPIVPPSRFFRVVPQN